MHAIVMCHLVRLVEVEGQKVMQYVTYEGEVLLEIPLEVPKKEELPPIQVRERKIIRK